VGRRRSAQRQRPGHRRDRQPGQGRPPDRRFRPSTFYSDCPRQPASSSTRSRLSSKRPGAAGAARTPDRPRPHSEETESDASSSRSILDRVGRTACRPAGATERLPAVEERAAMPGGFRPVIGRRIKPSAGPIWPSSRPLASPRRSPPSSLATRSWPHRSSCRGHISTPRRSAAAGVSAGPMRSWRRPARQRGYGIEGDTDQAEVSKALAELLNTKSERTLACRPA